MATRTAYYMCVSKAYKVFESDKTTEIATYKTHDIHGNDSEVGTESQGTYDDVANTFTFGNGDVIYL